MSIVHRSFSCIKKIEREGEEGGVRFKKGYGFSGEACIPGTSHITNLECGSELLRTCCCTPLDAKLYLKQHQKLGNGRGCRRGRRRASGRAECRERNRERDILLSHTWIGSFDSTKLVFLVL